jgi:hypothetical protein
MADTIMAMLIASASVDINMTLPLGPFIDKSTLQSGIWFQI